MMLPAPLSTIPEGLDVFNTADGTVIRKRWRDWTLGCLIPFIVFWDGFLFCFYGMIFAGGHKTPLVVKLFPTLHLAVGVGLTYYVIAALCNHTDFIVSPGEFRVKTTPVPWTGNKQVSASNVSAVFVRSRRGSKGSITYRVVYADRDRREHSLADVNMQEEQCAYVAATIRQRFGLPENGMDGDVPPALPSRF